LLLLAALGVVLLVWWIVFRLTHSITDDAFVEAHLVNVAPESVSGRIVRLLVEEDARVEKGDLLAVIDPVPYQDHLDLARSKRDAAEADLHRQEAALERLKEDVPLQIEFAEQGHLAAKAEVAKAEQALKYTTDEVEKTYDEAQAALAVAQANQVLAEQEYDRNKELYQQEAVPLRRFQEATRTNEASLAEVRLARARVAKADAARTKIVVVQRELDAARAMAEKAARAVGLARSGKIQIRETALLVEVKKKTLDEARSSLASAENTLNYTRVVAPFPGIVVKRLRNLGDFASAGTPILTMYNPDLVYVTANLEETRLKGVAPGNSVALHLDALSQPLRGRVLWINQSTGAEFSLMPRNVVSGEFTKVVQRVPVRIWIEKDDRWSQLRPGLSVRVDIAHGEGDPEWAVKTAREQAELEFRFNQP
jgi:membrane fusion protein (multidrug efflux system)